MIFIFFFASKQSFLVFLERKVWNALNCAIRPDALFNGVSFVVLQIRVQFLQLEESLFPGGLCPGRVQWRRDHGAFGYRVGNTLHLPGGRKAGKKGVK